VQRAMAERRSCIAYYCPTTLSTTERQGLL